MNIEEKVWEKVLTARHIKRPTAKVLINYLIDDFVELHGDRYYHDDLCMLSGVGLLNGCPITIISQEKGESTRDKIIHNFGMPHPEGYRKALRLMKQAEKFGRPILFIIDTPGAYPGKGAEERGQATAIANNLAQMVDIKVPMISIVLGEGGSGGALGIGITDEIWMFENSIYSILSPEGFASILYKDSSKAKMAAQVMRLTAEDLFEFRIVDKIIPEFNGGLHNEYEESFSILKKALVNKYNELEKVDRDILIKKRYKKYRDIGVYEET